MPPLRLVRRNTGAVSLAALLLTVATSPAFAQHTVTLTDLGTLGGSSSFAYGVNDSGDVVGEGFLPNDSTSHAFLWHRGVMVDLGTLAGDTRSAAFDINNRGQVVGHSSGNDGVPHPFLWSDGVMMPLPLLAGHTQGSAVAINNRGQVVGQSDGQAVLWENGKVIALRVAGSSFSIARGINELGKIVGSAIVDAAGPFPQAVLWENRVARMLPAPALPECPAGDCVLYTFASAINNRGVVSGVAANQEEQPHAVTWVNGRGIHLGTLPDGVDSFLHDGSINDEGDVVGGASVARNEFEGAAPILWSHGAVEELPSPQAPLRHSVATAISNRGHVVGIGVVSEVEAHAMLWTVAPRDRTAPRVRVAASRSTIWPVNGRRVPVTFVGTVRDDVSTIETVSYVVEDEYGRVEPSGRVRVSNGRFTITVRLEASRRGSDRNGRRYQLRVTGVDEAGNRATAAATVVVPHHR
jgi:probable HAF family extracellular repeat protein